MINNLNIPSIRLFVFGTLRVGGRLDFYMEGSSPHGIYYTEGQLMESENGSAFIDFSKKNVATIGELHHVNYPCLQRINHLEMSWGEFPKAYDLGLIPVWVYEEGKELNFTKEQSSLAFCYKRRTTSPVPGGDWMNRKAAMNEIGRFLKEETEHPIYHHDLILHMQSYLGE